MKINCIVKTTLEHETGFEPIVVAYDVGSGETIGSLLDRLLTFPASKSQDHWAVVEFRICRTSEDRAG